MVPCRTKVLVDKIESICWQSVSHQACHSNVLKNIIKLSAVIFFDIARFIERLLRPSAKYDNARGPLQDFRLREPVTSVFLISEANVRAKLPNARENSICDNLLSFFTDTTDS